MRKVILLVCLTLFILPAIFALNLDVSTNSTNVVLINNLTEPAIFNTQITNYGPSDNLQFYNLLGFSMFPDGTTPIGAGQTISIPLSIYPRPDFNYNGFYVFNYIIQGQSGDQLPESVNLKTINLPDAFTVGASEIDPQSNSITIYIKNNVNFNFDNVNTKFNSAFFTDSEQFSLAPYEEKDFQIALNKDQFKSLLAGFYTLSAQVVTGGQTATVNGNINFSQKNILNVSQNVHGFLITSKVIEKVNSGNMVADSQTVVQKNIISRLFTTFSPEPDMVNRQGLLVSYVWENQIQPGNTLTITTTTNWLFPLFIIIFVVAIVILVKQYSKTALSLEKRVSYMRAKGGEFALRVNVTLRARKFIEKVTVTERLPLMVKLYEKFGAEKPSRVDEKSRRIEWHFDKLLPGEMRSLSYIIYSKVGVLGRFALPKSRAVYQREGKVREVESNQAFLVTEQGAKRED
ncbi:MAG: hypothetical protein WAU65_02785 [Candidatus Nanoarchaeia archaeon]